MVWSEMRHGLRPALLAALVACWLAAILTGTASAAVSTTPDPTWGANGTVEAVERIGSTIYLGGEFTALVDPKTGATMSRSRVAAIDAATGRPLPWNPGADGTVFALDRSIDGATLYLGGDFTHVAGASRSRLAAVSAATGSLVSSFAPNANGTVRAIAASTGRVFVGGKFTSMNGASHSRIAAVDATSGANVSGWNPSVGGTVRGLVVSLNGSTLFICGGGFTSVSGQHRAYAAAVNTSNGSLLPWAPNPDRPIYALAIDASNVYAAAGGAGGQVYAWSVGSGAVVWQNHTDGDVDAVAVLGSQVFAGGHFTLEQGATQARLVALSVSQGVPDTSFHPTLTGNSLGAIALASDGTHLAIGGDFTKVNGVNQPRLTSFGSH
jgi:WD40 repeat protein